MIHSSSLALKKGDIAPAIDASVVYPGRPGQARFILSDHRSQPMILYFYPKDDTPGCTQESCDFRDAYAQFQESGVSIYGVSKDTVTSHHKFIHKYHLPFPLITDESGEICGAYGVWAEKSMYGKKYWGIERTTFLIMPDGTIGHVWNKVKVPSHVEMVLAETKSLLAQKGKK